MVVDAPLSPDGRRRGLAAALLNVSGLGAGYIYLGLWARAVGAWLVTLAVVLAANALNASDTALFWSGVYVVWLAAMVADGRRLGRRPADVRTLFARRSRRWLPPAVAAALLVLVATGLAIHRGTPADELAKAERAHADGDCERARVHYDRAAAGRYEFTLSQAVADARAGRVSCRFLLNAEAAADREAFTEAIADYNIYLNRHDGEPPWPGAEARLVELRLAYADMLLAEDTGEGYAGYQTAFEQYLTVRDEHGEVPGAEEVPARLDAMYDAATAPMADGRPCQTLTALEALLPLPETREAPAADELAGRAEGALPDALYACGEGRYADEQYTEAREVLERMVGDYPEDERADRASELLIAIEIGLAQGGSPGELPPPTAAGSAPGSSVTVEIVNDSPEPLEVLYSGAETGTARVEACDGCTTHTDVLEGFGGSGCTTDLDRPALTLELPPGSYEFVVRARSDTSVTPFYGSWALAAGTAYSDCYYISESSFGF
ncbi:tetratricopeptide repeat protein [Streptomyces litchfieldiae]|uniref:Uncharacterized protein n=1 Tax=Streptomyces litchfieldiae TaxID=3075543 RepID=A0ABU2MPX1_9ACTN|nr:hypothetical protein [Streptomyces sp. DSM 44938]MDT0343661.1 hypothetical protein [Streptomyces sp. DSM 44938]